MSGTVVFGNNGGARGEGSIQTWTVPAGVTSVICQLWGGAGAGSGNPGFLKATLAVNPGDVLNIVVGGSRSLSDTVGGYNGGGDAGGASAGPGGGATDIRIGGSGLPNRVLVAGGSGGQGGGAGNSSARGGDGGSVGGAGRLPGGSTGGGGGGGGTVAAGGAAGSAANGTGTAGSGGTGGAGSGNTPGGGGGGAGYFGGGGGGITSAALGCGGGGGANFIAATVNGSAPTGTVSGTADGTANHPAGQSQVTLTYDTPPNAPTTQAPANNSFQDTSVGVAFAWGFSDPDDPTHSGTDWEKSADLQYRASGASSWTTVSLGPFDPPDTPGGRVGGQWQSAPNLFAAGTVYEWQVRSYDASSVVGAWSASQFFTAANPPGSAPTITSPAAGSAIFSPTVGLVWTTPTTQLAYQVRILGDDGAGNAVGQPLYDSGEVASSSKALTVTVPGANGQVRHLQVRYSEHAGIGHLEPVGRPWPADHQHQPAGRAHGRADGGPPEFARDRGHRQHGRIRSHRSQ
jgi:hypothetical protein